MTDPSKIIAFRRVAVPRPALGALQRFEGYPRFAREYASPAPLPMPAAVSSTAVVPDE